MVGKTPTPIAVRTAGPGADTGMEQQLIGLILGCCGTAEEKPTCSKHKSPFSKSHVLTSENSNAKRRTTIAERKPSK
jgi:hypothetical protein